MNDLIMADNAKREVDNKRQSMIDSFTKEKDALMEKLEKQQEEAEKDEDEKEEDDDEEKEELQEILTQGREEIERMEAENKEELDNMLKQQRGNADDDDSSEDGGSSKRETPKPFDYSAVGSIGAFAPTPSANPFFAGAARPDSRAYKDYRRFLLETSQVAGGFYSARGRRQLLRQTVDMMLAEHDPYDALKSGTAAPRQQLRVVR